MIEVFWDSSGNINHLDNNTIYDLKGHISHISPDGNISHIIPDGNTIYHSDGKISNISLIRKLHLRL